MGLTHPAWGVFQYEVTEAVPPAGTASAFERAMVALGRHGGSLIHALENAPFFAASFADATALESFARQRPIIRWSIGSGPADLDLPRPVAPSRARLGLFDEGAPDPVRAEGIRLEVRGDTRPFGHPIAIVRTVAQSLDADTEVLALGLPREARQWPWMQAIDHALVAGARVLQFSWGRLPQEVSNGWDLLEAAIECFLTFTDACFVAAVGNGFKGGPALLPARNPSVLGIAGLRCEETLWRAYGANRFGPDVTNELSALADDPGGGGGGTSFAVARVAPRLARWLQERAEASSQTLRAVALVGARSHADDPHGDHDERGWVGRSLGLGEPDEGAMREATVIEGRGPGSIEVDASSRMVIAWNPRPLEWLLRGRGPGLRSLRVDAPVVFAAPSWLILETRARRLTIETERDCPWAAAWRPV